MDCGQHNYSCTMLDLKYVHGTVQNKGQKIRQ